MPENLQEVKAIKPYSGFKKNKNEKGPCWNESVSSRFSSPLKARQLCKWNERNCVKSSFVLRSVIDMGHGIWQNYRTTISPVNIPYINISSLSVTCLSFGCIWTRKASWRCMKYGLDKNPSIMSIIVFEKRIGFSRSASPACWHCFNLFSAPLLVSLTIIQPGFIRNNFPKEKKNSSRLIACIEILFLYSVVLGLALDFTANIFPGLNRYRKWFHIQLDWKESWLVLGDMNHPMVVLNLSHLVQVLDVCEWVYCLFIRSNLKFSLVCFFLDRSQYQSWSHWVLVLTGKCLGLTFGWKGSWSHLDLTGFLFWLVNVLVSSLLEGVLVLSWSHLLLVLTGKDLGLRFDWQGLWSHLDFTGFLFWPVNILVSGLVGRGLDLGWCGFWSSTGLRWCGSLSCLGGDWYGLVLVDLSLCLVLGFTVKNLNLLLVSIWHGLGKVLISTSMELGTDW